MDTHTHTFFGKLQKYENGIQKTCDPLPARVKSELIKHSIQKRQSSRITSTHN